MKLFHYCSLESLFAILNSYKYSEDSKCKLWLSSLTESNDPNEDVWLFYLFYDYLKKKNRKSKHQENNNLVIKMAFREYQKAKAQNNIFGISLTELEDDPIMWMSYCRRGGARIEFDSQDLEKTFASFGMYKELLKLGKVEYFSNKIRNEPEMITKINDIWQKEGNGCPINCFDKLFEISPFIKSTFWKHEKEWRIAFRYHAEDLKNHYVSSMYSTECDVKAGYKMVDGRPIIHFSLPFDIEIIKSIKLAPHENMNSEEFAFKLSTLNEKIAFSTNPVDEKQILIEKSSLLHDKD